jgi:very-short-patch-repair endonuclease
VDGEILPLHESARLFAVHPAAVLSFLGGAGRRSDLLRHTTRRALESAVRSGDVEHVGVGKYALPALPAALKVGATLGGVVSHESAAQYWRLESIADPLKIHITLPPTAHRTARRNVALHYSALPARESQVTSPVRTIIDCARTLPFREALAIADSALRRALITKEELLEAASGTRGPGCRQVRRVATLSDALAANPLESALRASALDAGLTGLVPQLLITEDNLNYHVDLGDRGRRIAAEGDSFAFHGTPGALERDCRRYNELTSRGWRLLRFSYDQAIFDETWVMEKLTDTYRLPFRPDQKRMVA